MSGASNGPWLDVADAATFVVTALVLLLWRRRPSRGATPKTPSSVPSAASPERDTPAGA